MIINKPLNKIFSANSSVAVLRELRFTENGFTGREIAKRAGLSPPAALKALSNLESLKIIKRRIGGRDHIFTLNFSNYLVKQTLLPLFDSESQFYNEILNRLKKMISRESESIIQFGSVARKEESVESDFDVCIVFTAIKEKKILEQKINKLRDDLYREFGVLLAPFFISSNEFQKKARRGQSPVKNIIEDGIVISGKSINRLLND